MRRIARALLFGLVFATTATAQEATVAIWGYETFGVPAFDGSLPPSLELRATIPTSERFAVEPFISAGRRHTARGTSTEGLFGVQIRQRLVGWTDEGGFVFASYGAATYGPFARLRPDMEGWDVYPAVLGQIGLGLRRRLSEHVGLRPEIQVMTVGPIPIG